MNTKQRVSAPRGRASCRFGCQRVGCDRISLPRNPQGRKIATNNFGIRRMSVKIGAKVVSHGRYVTFQMAEVAVPRQMFKDILMLIAQLRAPPAPA